MQKSNTKTEYIMVKTYTSNEHDSCDYAIITVKPEWIEWIKSGLETIDKLKTDERLSHIVYWDAPCEFYIDGDTLDIASEIIGDTDYWCYVTISQKDIDARVRPEDYLTGYETRLHSDGFINFQCKGQYSETLYYTALINTKEIIN